MEKILIKKDIEIYVDNRIQKGTIERNFQCTGCRENLNIPRKWINKRELFHSIWTFRYLDNRSEGFEIETGYNNEFIKLEKI
jgi:hypothetical protein